MAVFEDIKCRDFSDDLQNFNCIIEAAESVQGHTVYIIRVNLMSSPDISWQVTRRYSDFDALNSSLLCSEIELPLPPKKVFGKFDREFVAERQQRLQAYMNFILSHPLLSKSIHVKKFLDPTNYSFNFLEVSLQQISMIFRSELDWEVIEPLLDIGWRIRKQYFSIKYKKEVKKPYISSWMALGPDCYLSMKDLNLAVKLLNNMQHASIYPPSLTSVNHNGILVIYDFLENGTLRDLLYKVKPKANFLKKYGNPKLYYSLDLSKIQTYSQQILLALKFMHDRGFFHGHLHSGNVVIIDGTCKLMDIFNGIAGVPCFFKSYLLEVKTIQTVEDIDIYCFGHLLYEMAFGVPLLTPYCDYIPITCAPELRSVLEAILTKEACKNKMPSISDLLHHPFFSTITYIDEKVSLKVPIQLKECLKTSKACLEKHLRNEQKTMKYSKRMSKVQITEVEKKKSQKKKKENQYAENCNENEASLNPEAAVITSTEEISTERTDFLSSIQKFNKEKLAKIINKDEN